MLLRKLTAKKSPYATLNRLDDTVGYRRVARGPFLQVDILANFKTI